VPWDRAAPGEGLEQFTEDGRLRSAGPWPLDALDRTEGGKVRIDPEPDLQTRLEHMKTARNPLLEAARPLLRILSEMPKKLPDGENVLEEFRAVLDREVRSFQTLCDKASLRREHVLTARYCLCTAIDEAASSTDWGRDGVWAMSSLAQRFHQDVKGGEKFFLLVGRLTVTPT